MNLTGDLDLYTAGSLREALVADADSSDELLVVDLSEVDFLDSTGMGALVAAHQARRRGIAVICPQPRLRKLFRITALDEAMPIGRSLADALSAARAPDESN
jgi:anti-sigma B factor antagonist